MKNILLIASFVLFPLCTLAKVKNGYSSSLQADRIRLHRFQTLLSFGQNMNAVQRRKTKAEIRQLQCQLIYFELTERAIAEFQKISPGIYAEIDTLKDSRGRETDVYVRLVPNESSRYGLSGASFFRQSLTDPDANNSVYADHTVLIDVLIDDNSLVSLCHEIGHVKYIIPNLATYMKFYNRNYKRDATNWSYHGHSPGDVSGRMAYAYVRKFKLDLHEHLRIDGNKPTRIWLALLEIRKNVTLDSAKIQ